MKEQFWEPGEWPDIDGVMQEWIDGNVKEAIRQAVEEEGWFMADWENGEFTIEFWSFEMADEDKVIDESGRVIKDMYGSSAPLSEMLQEIASAHLPEKEAVEAMAAELERVASKIRALANK